jgi:hypothetical protein
MMEEKNQPKKSQDSVSVKCKVKFPNDFVLKLSSPSPKLMQELKDFLKTAYDVEPTSAIMLTDDGATTYFQFIKISPKDGN